MLIFCYSLGGTLASRPGSGCLRSEGDVRPPRVDIAVGHPHFHKINNHQRGWDRARPGAALG